MKKNIRIVSLVLSFLFLGLIIFLTLSPKISYTSVVKNLRASDDLEIYGDVRLEQHFQSTVSEIDILSFSISEYFDGNLQYKLLKNNDVVFESSYTYEDVKDNLLQVKLGGISVQEDDEFVMDITCVDCTESSPLILKLASEIGEKELGYINGENPEQAICFTLTGYKYNYTFTLIFSFLFLFSFSIFSFLTINNDSSKRLKLYFVLEFLLSLIAFWLAFLCISSFRYEMYFNLWLLIFTLLVCSGLIVIFIKLLKIKFLKKEQIYLILGIPLAIAYMIFVIPGFVADEPAHFWRAYNLIDDNILSVDSGIKMPEHFLHYNMGVINDYSNLNTSLEIATDYNDEVDYMTSANGYSIILYVFVEIGLIIGKSFSLPAMVTFYLARLFNTIGMLLFGYFIIKKIPFGKNVALVYLLNPMYIHQGVSVSADSMVNSICLLFIAILLSFRNKDKCETRDFVLLGLITILMGFAKYIYIPLLLLFFLFVFISKK